jgi:uridine kinase
MENSGQLNKKTLIGCSSCVIRGLSAVFYLNNNYCLLVLWQRDMAERGHSLESIKASIEARKPDFDAFIGMSSAS